MTSEALLYQLPYFAAAAAALWAATVSWLRRRMPVAGASTLLLLALSIWSLAYGLQIGCRDPQLREQLVKLEYLGIALAPLSWWVVAAELSGNRAWITRRWIALLALIPAVTLLLVWGGDPGRLIWKERILEPAGPLSIVRSDYGPWFWIHYAYSHALLLVGAAMIVQLALRQLAFYRLQLALLVGGMGLPWLVNVLYVFRVGPFARVDPTSACFTVSALLTLWALQRWRLFDLIPVARAAFFEAMRDGVIVLDAKGRLIDLNTAAEVMLGRPVREVFGRPFDTVLPNQIATLLGECDEGCAGEAVVAGDRVVEVMVTAVRDARGTQCGRLLVCHDQTERKLAEARLRYLSTHDRLTGLYNRAYFEEEMARQAAGRSFPVSLLVADLDGLKVVNDSRGHAAGDELLRRAAGLLSEVFRGEDVVARVGGDEFAVLLPRTDTPAATAAVVRVKMAVASHLESGDDPLFSLSVGAATAEEGSDLLAALREADRDMYRAKRESGAHPQLQ